MRAVWFESIAYILYVYLLLIILRVVVEIVRMFARAWRPAGTAAVVLELLYVSTDPPVKLFRRLIPPLRLGGVSIDLSIYLLLIIILVLRAVALRLA